MYSLRLLVLILFLGPSAHALAEPPLQVLILHSYSQEYSWTRSQHEGFTSRYYAGTRQPTIISSEYLDTKRHEYNTEYADNFFKYMQNRYQGYQPDLIYVTDDNALLFALQYAERLFADTPIIFSGINNTEIEKHIDHNRITGVLEKKNISANLKLLQQMDPDIRDILVVGDASSTYQAIEIEIRKQLQQHPHIVARFIADQNIENIVAAVQESQARYLFLTTLGNVTSADGHMLTLQDIVTRIVNAKDVTTLSMEDAYLFDGVLGGLVTSGRLQGITAADMALSLQQGKAIRDMPVITETPGELILDDRELRKKTLQLPQALLSTATILHQPPTFYQRNRNLVLGLIVFLTVLFIFSVLYFLTLLSRKNIQIQTTASKQKELEDRVYERTRELQLEKQKLNQAQAITHIGNYVWDVEENMTTWSDELYRIAGQDPKTFKPSYENYVDCIHPDDRELFLTLTGTVVETRKPYHAEYRIQRPNGDIRYVYEQGEVKINNRGELLRLVGVIQDITDNKRNESQLGKERDFNATVLEAAGNVIVILDTDGCFVRFNRAAEELTGFRSEEVIGKPIWDSVIPEDQMQNVKAVFDNLRQGKTELAAQNENDWLLRDGSRRTLDWRNSVLRDKQGNITHIVSMGYDMTARQAAEAEQERLQRELNQARKMEALGQLTGGIAHDFNNMLGIISGYTDLAIDQYGNELDATLKTYFDNISTASKRARDLVKQMMVFSHSEKTHKRPLAMQPLVEENVSMLRSVMPSSIKIQVKYEAGLPQVMLDPVQLQQMMLNLCLNARDAMAGIGELNIRLGWHRHINRECNACHKWIQGNWVELSVSDDGAGMEEQVIERIFEPFFTTKEVGKGTGMGMSVLHAIMDSHQGHVFIDSQKDQGTCFRLVFPPLPDMTEHQLLPDALDKLPAIQGNQQRILIVDDEPALANFLAELLNSCGYQCTSINHSPKALQLVRQHPEMFDLVITDQTMPDLTGVEMIIEIRKIKPRIPIILTTGYSDSIDRQSADRLKIAFMDKPINTSELLEYVANALQATKFQTSTNPTGK